MQNAQLTRDRDWRPNSDARCYRTKKWGRNGPIFISSYHSHSALQFLHTPAYPQIASYTYYRTTQSKNIQNHVYRWFPRPRRDHNSRGAQSGIEHKRKQKRFFSVDPAVAVCIRMSKIKPDFNQ